jgi:hypothetical protein
MIRAGKRIPFMESSVRSASKCLLTVLRTARRRTVTDPEREEFIQKLAARYVELLRKGLADEPRTLDEIEQRVEEIGRGVEAELERRLLERREQPPVPEDNQAACPQCGRPARYKATDERQLITRHGEHTLARRRYHCASCRHGFHPLDAALGLDRGETTQQVRLWVAEVAPRATVGEGASLLARLTGVQLGGSTFERIAVHVGAALRQAEWQAARQHHAGHPPPVQRKPHRLYVSVDGIFAPLRDPWKKDGSCGPLACRYGECKTAVIYEAKPGPKGDEGVVWRAYTASFADSQQFGPLVATLAHRGGHHFAKELVFLADGQAYNWTIAASQFPAALQIVDFQHAVSHLFEVAHAFFGEGTSPVRPWVEARKAELLEDRVAAVSTAISDLVPHTQEQRKLQAREIGYFTTNAERMRYGTFQERGYHIATGVMEAACKQVVHQRLDQVGMHWRQETAEAFVALRAAVLSTSPPDLRPYCRMSAGKLPGS